MNLDDKIKLYQQAADALNIIAIRGIGQTAVNELASKIVELDQKRRLIA